MADISDYDRNKYRHRDPEDTAEPAEGTHKATYHQDPFAPKTNAVSQEAQAFSRDVAANRYRSERRHVSNGLPTAFERKEERRVAGSGAYGAHGVGEAVAPSSHRRRNIILAVLGVLLICLILWYASLAAAMRPGEDVSKVVTFPLPGKPYYVLLLGSDSREDTADDSRADSIMLARVDELAKKVTIVSLPRDLRVEIPGHGTDKLNASFAYGGVSCCIETVEKFANVDISYYACIYFSGFEQLVDDLGGVTVEVPEGTYYDGVRVPAGDAVTIDGEEALVLARCRHGDPPDQGAYAAGDYQRTLNQRNLVKAIAKKALHAPLWKMPGVITSVAQCVETNMPPYKLAFLALAMHGMDTDSMYMAVVPSSPKYINGVSYVIADNNAWSAMMTRVKAGEDPNC